MLPTIKIDLRKDRVGYDAGFIGETNHRRLDIRPPEDLRASAYFQAAFEINGAVCRPPVTTAGARVQVDLAPPVTSQALTRMTLEGYREDGTILGKAHAIELYFLDAVQGEPGAPAPCPPGCRPGGGGGDGGYAALEEALNAVISQLNTIGDILSITQN